MRKRCFRQFVVAVCLVLGWVAATAQSPDSPAVPSTSRTAELLKTGAEPIRIVCLGDSVTGVYYHTGGRRAYPEMLQVALKRLFPNVQLEVSNAGISGNSTVDGLKRLDSDVLSRKPQLVTVMFGLNDVVRVPQEDYEANLSTIVRRCREAGAEVLLCTPNSVTDTPARPVRKLEEYVAGVRRVGEREHVPVVDCYALYEAVRAEAPLKWMMLMSDEIHPNMVGHKLFAEGIAKAISGRSVSLDDEGPPLPLLPKTQALLKEGNKPLHIYAIPPYDTLASSALKVMAPDMPVEVTTWTVEGQTLAQIEDSAKNVRERKPDLVIVAVPAEAQADSTEQFIRSYKWVLNYALSFGHQEWDCIAVLPSATKTITDAAAQERERLARVLVWAQDIGMVERTANDARSPEEVFTTWLRAAVNR